MVDVVVSFENMSRTIPINGCNQEGEKSQFQTLGASKV